MKFSKWLDTLIVEKCIDLEQTFEVEGDSGTNTIPYGVVVEHIKITTKQEQEQIKKALVLIDFNDGDVYHFFRYLGKAIAV